MGLKMPVSATAGLSAGWRLSSRAGWRGVLESGCWATSGLAVSSRARTRGRMGVPAGLELRQRDAGLALVLPGLVGVAGLADVVGVGLEEEDLADRPVGVDAGQERR